MSKLNQVSNPSIYSANQSENTIKNNHIKKTNQSNLSFGINLKILLKRNTRSNTNQYSIPSYAIFK